MLSEYEKRRRASTFKKLGLFIAAVSSIVTFGVVASNSVYKQTMNASASGQEYETVAEWAKDPDMRPVIDEALHDGRLTEGDYQEISATADNLRLAAAIQKIRDAETSNG